MIKRLVCGSNRKVPRRGVGGPFSFAQRGKRLPSLVRELVHLLRAVEPEMLWFRLAVRSTLAYFSRQASSCETGSKKRNSGIGGVARSSMANDSPISRMTSSIPLSRRSRKSMMIMGVGTLRVIRLRSMLARSVSSLWPMIPMWLLIQVLFYGYYISKNRIVNKARVVLMK